MKYTITRIFLAAVIVAGNAFAEDYFYRISLSLVNDGKHQVFYVKYGKDMIGIAKDVETNVVLIFPETYAYMIASDKFEKISVWDDQLLGVMAIRGENIISIQQLVGNPISFKSKDRVFCVPSGETDKK